MFSKCSILQFQNSNNFFSENLIKSVCQGKGIVILHYIILICDYFSKIDIDML